MSPYRRLVERIESPSFLDGLEEKSVEELRADRAECQEAERELSFERRLCQARMDILSAEIEQRQGRASQPLVERLPQILAKEDAPRSDGLPTRAPDSSIPRNADVPRRRVDEIIEEQALARLFDVPEAELRTIIESLSAHEKRVSEQRKRVHEVVDAIQEEIVKRYTSGQADPTQAPR